MLNMYACVLAGSLCIAIAHSCCGNECTAVFDTSKESLYVCVRVFCGLIVSFDVRSWGAGSGGGAECDRLRERYDPHVPTEPTKGNNNKQDQ